MVKIAITVYQEKAVFLHVGRQSKPLMQMVALPQRSIELQLK
jgi:hypothetical protein